MEIEETSVSKNLDEAVRLQSEKRREWIRGERLQGIAEGTSNVPRLASSLAASFPGKNQCPRTHCNLIEQENREDSSAREIEVNQKTEQKTKWRGQNESQRR